MWIVGMTVYVRRSQYSCTCLASGGGGSDGNLVNLRQSFWSVIALLFPISLRPVASLLCHTAFHQCHNDWHMQKQTRNAQRLFPVEIPAGELCTREGTMERKCLKLFFFRIEVLPENCLFHSVKVECVNFACFVLVWMKMGNTFF